MFPWPVLLCLHVGQKFWFSTGGGWISVELLNACEDRMTDNRETKLLISQVMFIIKGSALPLESYEAFINCESVEIHNTLCVQDILKLMSIKPMEVYIFFF